MLAELLNRTNKKRQQCEEAATNDWRDGIKLTDSPSDSESCVQCPYCFKWVHSPHPEASLIQHRDIHPSQNATNKEEMERLGVKKILTVAIQSPTPHTDAFTYKKLDLEDVDSQLLRPYFEEAFQFIDDRKEEDKVLVHCVQGVSRSATFIVAYVMKKEGIEAREAMKFVNSRRKVNPNRGFLYQLSQYELELFPERSEPSLKVVPYWLGSDSAVADVPVLAYTTPHEVLPKLYLGSLHVSRDEKFMQDNNITHVISILEKGAPNLDSSKIKHLHLPLADHVESDMYSHFQEICDFIEQARETNAVLVHCTSGVSSAPTAVLSYLMKKEKLPLDEAFASLKERRPLIQPNLGFMQQLRKWQDATH